MSQEDEHIAESEDWVRRNETPGSAMEQTSRGERSGGRYFRDAERQSQALARAAALIDSEALLSDSAWR